MAQPPSTLISTEFWYRSGEAVESAQLDIDTPRALDDGSGYACRIRWTLGGDQKQRDAFGANQWQAVLTALCMLYWEVESLQLSRQAQLYWTARDAKQQTERVDVSSLFGGLEPSPSMSQRR